MRHNNPVESVVLIGFLPTPLSVAANWPEMYRQPNAIAVRRHGTAFLYPWSARRERAIIDALLYERGCMMERRRTPYEYEYLVSDGDR